MQCSQSLLPVGRGLSFHFVHLTIQEFLAALHIVTLPSDEILKVFETHAWNDRFAMVWRFVFGLGCKKESICSRKVVCLDHEVIDQFVSRLGSFALLLCHCSVESKDSIVSVKIAKQLNGQLDGYIGSKPRNPQDFAAIFHVLKHTSCCSNLRINLCRCGLKDKQLKELTDILSSANGRLQVKELTLFDNKLTDTGITDLLTLASSSFFSLKSLSLNRNSITDISPLFSSCSCLSYLSLSDNPFKVSGIQSLVGAIKTGSLAHLIELYISNTLTDDADINGALLTTLLPSIASRCPYLRYLDLSRNILGVPGASALAEIFSLLTCNRSRFELDLSDTSMNESITAFSNIMTTGTSEQPCACRLKFNDNRLGYDGLLAIYRILKNGNCRIDSLYLDNSLTSQIHDYNILCTRSNALLNSAPALESSKLSFLSLSNNSLSGSKISLLFECIRICTSLKRLFCWRCSLTSSDIVSFMTCLKIENISHKNLRQWFLRGNSIDDEGVTILIESLPKHFPCLDNINLGDNPVTEETALKCLEVSNMQCKHVQMFECHIVLCIA